MIGYGPRRRGNSVKRFYRPSVKLRLLRCNRLRKSPGRPPPGERAHRGPAQGMNVSIAQRADREACVNGMRIFSTFGRGICPTWPFGAITAKMGGQANSSGHGQPTRLPIAAGSSSRRDHSVDAQPVEQRGRSRRRIETSSYSARPGARSGSSRRFRSVRFPLRKTDGQIELGMRRTSLGIRRQAATIFNPNNHIGHTSCYRNNPPDGCHIG